VIEVASHGVVTLQDDSGNIFKVNGQCLKVFLEPKNLEEIDVIELLQFKDLILKLLCKGSRQLRLEHLNT
jgi:hypothetical protein